MHKKNEQNFAQKFVHSQKFLFIFRGNNPMVGMTVAVAVAIEEAMK